MWQWQWQLPSWSPFWHCQSQSTLPAANFQLPASEPKANNAYNDNRNNNNSNNNDGKWGKWKRRFRETLALPFAFALVFAIVFVFAFISISLGACFHFGFTFDLTVVRASVATVRLAWLRFVSQFVYLAPSPALRFNARQGKRHTNIYARREDNANARQKFDSPFTNE